MRKILLLFLTVLFSVGLASAKSYTIEFKNDSKDYYFGAAGEALEHVESGAEYIQDIPYSGMTTTGYGKYGHCMYAGRKLTINLSESGQVAATSVVVKASRRANPMGDTGNPSTLVLNGVESEPVTDTNDTYTDLKFDLDGSTLTSLVLSSANGMYVKSITITYAPAYSIVFKNDSKDYYFGAAGEALEHVESGAEYIQDIPYSGMTTTGYGKYGHCMYAGRKLTINLSESGQVAATSVVVKASRRANPMGDTGNPSTLVLNGVESEPVTDTNDTYTDLKFDLDGSILTSLVLSSANGMYVKSITIKEGGAKKPVELTFDAETASAVVGEEFTAPKLTCSVDGLEISYSSSNTAVATVAADGKVTPVAGGQTEITARFAGNNEYSGAQAKYMLTVIAVVNSMAEFEALKPEGPKKPVDAKINFPCTVAYQGVGTTSTGVSAKHTYIVADADNVPMLVYGDETPDYEVGDVIPTGWTATYKSPNSSKYFCAVVVDAPKSSSEKATFAPEVATNVNGLKRYGVYIVKDVTFENGTTPTVTGDINGTYTEIDGRDETPNKKITFRQYFGLDNLAAGKYNVTFVVEDNGAGGQILCPVKYELVQGSGVESIVEDEIPAEYFTLEGIRVENPAKGIYIRRQGEKVTKVLIK